MFSGMGFRVTYSNGKKEVDAIQPTFDDAVEFAHSTFAAFGPGRVTIEAEATSNEGSKKGGSMSLVEQARKIIANGGMASVMPELIDRLEEDKALTGLLGSIEGLIDMLESAEEHGIDVSEEQKRLVGLLKKVIESDIFDSAIKKALDMSKISEGLREEIAGAYVNTYTIAKFTIAAAKSME